MTLLYIPVAFQQLRGYFATPLAVLLNFSSKISPVALYLMCESLLRHDVWCVDPYWDICLLFKTHFQTVLRTWRAFKSYFCLTGVIKDFDDQLEKISLDGELGILSMFLHVYVCERQTDTDLLCFWKLISDLPPPLPEIPKDRPKLNLNQPIYANDDQSTKNGNGEYCVTIHTSK